MEYLVVEKRKSVRPPPSRTPTAAGVVEKTKTKTATTTTTASSSSSSSDIATTVGDFDAELDMKIRGALRSAEMDLLAGGGGGETAPKPPPDTPGGRLMREYGSIDVDVVASSSSDDDDDDDDDDAAMLAEAQREAEEAEDMLRQAEEEVRLAELEAAMWEEELASLGGGGAARAESAAESEARDSEVATLSSMAEAYREALEASNDSASALREQVIGLEVELADATSKMERASEDRERIGAEYAYLARNYNDLKRKSSSEGATSSSSSSSSAASAAAAAAAEEKVVALTGEIESYKSRIADAETRLAGLETSLAEARSDAERWRTMHDDVSDRASRAATVRDVEHAEEMRAAGEHHELRILEARRSLEEARARMISEKDASANVLRAEFDRSLEENSKMISALRAALRKTRKESTTTTKTTDAGGGGIEGESSSLSSSDDLVDVRTKMTEEVANLRSVLKSVQGEMDEKEREVLRAMEGRGETEKLMEEVR